MSALKQLLLYTALLFCTNQLCAQTRPADKNFKLIFEKVYLHTDRTLYAAGDDIWFKAYLVNGQSNQPLGLSNNLYVELISPQGNISSRQIIRLDYGLGNGDIKLTDSLITGRYRLRAYTNWMRNFGNNFVFEKNVDIIGTPSSRHPEEADRAVTNKTTIGFYPEGGSLLEGVSSIVGIKATDGLGNGLKTKGAVLNAMADTVASFTTDSLGLGMFAFLPLKGQHYRYVLSDIKNADYSPFPGVLTNGLSLSVRHSDTLINVIINANDAAFAQYSGKTFWLSGKQGGVLCLRKPVRLTGNQTIMRVPQSFFPEGITNLTLYDDESKPHTERLIYVNHPGQNASLSIGINKAMYASRESVTVKLKLSDTSAKANLSLAVVDAAAAPVPTENIGTYLMLTSELKGEIQHPERYFDTTNVNRFKQMDMLLLTQGWRDFIWRRLADTAITLSYPAERGFEITGRLRQKFANKPIANTNLVLTVRGTKQQMYLAKTDSLGRYKFQNLILKDSAQIVLAAYNDKHKKVGFVELDTMHISPPIPILSDVNPQLNSAAEIRAIENEAGSYSKFASLNQLKVVSIKESKQVRLMDMIATKFYPDEVLTVTAKDQSYQNLRDYILHRSNQARADVETDDIVFFGDKGERLKPRLFVNNRELPFNDTDPPEVADDYYNTYFGISMNMVNKVVIQKLLTQTDMNFDAAANYMSRITPPKPFYVIYLSLKPGALDNVNVNTLTASANGYYQARAFFKPAYNKPSDLHMPDLRKTIHWEPNITTKNGEATVTYYNADLKGNIRLIVQGITDKGAPLVAGTGYEVK